jgi:hypothetical protein
MIILDPSHQVHSRDALSIQSPSHYTANWLTLCPELIYEILTYCLSGVTLYTDAPRSFPWYLGHVCRSWRSVFVSSPRFWDHFSFEFRPMGKIRLQRALALVKLCIERTKDHPFSFEFRVSRIYDDTVPLSPLLETLVAHADRWRAACLVADGNQLKSLTRAKGRLGQLHSLEIGHFGWSDPRTPFDVFQDAPNLSRVWVTSNGHYQLPWSTLAALHVHVSRFAHSFLKNLDKTMCLEELVITGRYVRPDVANTRPIELPSLRMLSVEYFPRDLHIKTPALKIFHLGGALPIGSPTVETLLRGVCNLKTLSFDVDDIPNGRVIEWTPELNHLILSCTDAMSLEAFQSLLQSLASHATAYSLTKISVGDPEPSCPLLSTSIMHMHILSTVIETWEKHQFPKLRFVSVHVNDERSEEITSAIADLMRVGADKGAEIDVNSSPLPTKLAFW